jgi:hypothetical protein
MRILSYIDLLPRKRIRESTTTHLCYTYTEYHLVTRKRRENLLGTPKSKLMDIGRFTSQLIDGAAHVIGQIGNKGFGVTRAPWSSISSTSVHPPDEEPYHLRFFGSGELREINHNTSILRLFDFL